MKFRPEFAEELNQDGFSPLHIASSYGYVELVTELLMADCNLSLLKGRDRRIPLHYAAIKGRARVVEVLLLSNLESIEEVTAQGETALHLAVKNYQFEALRVLVVHLKQFNEEGVNKKDGQGNTILHYAVSRMQFEVVDLVLKGHVTEGSVEVNALNQGGFTPLDVLLLFQSEAGDREIEEILRHAGAMRAIALPSLTQVATNQNQCDATSNSPNDHSRTALQPRSPYKLLLEYFKYDQIQDSPSKVHNTLLVMATLITTATYQAVLSPPGGVWQDDSGSPNKNGRNTTEPHIAGQTVMGSNDPISYFMFLLSNSIGFFTSVQMILILTKGFPLRMELVISVVALIATYNTCMTAIAPKSIIITVYFAATSAVIPITAGIATRVVRNNLRGQRDVIPYTNQASV